MSFTKAANLLRLAEMAAARHMGVGLADIEQEFEVDRRTAQRMTKALADCFPHVETRTDDERRKYWSLRGHDARLVQAQGIRDGELTALEMALRRADRDGAANEARALATLRDRLLSSMPGPHARRAEADAVAVLEAQGFASRPGARVRSDPHLLAVIAEALKVPSRLSFTYARSEGAPGERREVEPYGVLLGTRRYLVARDAGGDGVLRHFRVDRMGAPRLEMVPFDRDPDFSLDDHAARAFGSFHSDAEYSEVVWRFTPEAAPAARGFVFHPRQEATEEADGSLTLRFTASGWLEMAWHLYQWGDAVEVLAPRALRDMVADNRRGDFPAFP